MNGLLELRTVLTIVIFVLQMALGAFGYAVRSDTRSTNEHVILLRAEVRSNAGRIAELEKFAAAGDRWTIADHMMYEAKMVTELKELWQALGELKVEMAKRHGEK